MLRVEGHKNLYRDERSGAIVSTDSSGYDQYMKLKEKQRVEREEIDRLKSEIEEIKFMLKELTKPTT